MKQTICHQVRFEIDEKDLAAPLSADAIDHLRYCSECQEFQTKETKLRKIVGSLETVNAPADFDFRLRARLANDRNASYRLASPVRVWRLRSVAVAAMLLIFAGTVFIIHQTDPWQSPTQNADSATNHENVTPPAKPTETPSDVARSEAANEQPTSPTVDEQKSNNVPRRVGPTTSTNKRSTVAVDFSSTSAAVIRAEQSSATMTTFPLDVSQQSFKVSLDDGRGSSRTISVPTVSFGSRRVLAGGSMSSNQFAPKGDW
jgi:hypothetical protein